MSDSRNIVAIVGNNENGILRQVSQDLMALLEPEGVRGHVIAMGKPDWPARLTELIQEGITMAWGCAGIGAAIASNGQNLWESMKIPFISVMADSPCARPSNHFVRSCYVANAYLFSEWLHIQRTCIRSPQYSTLVNNLGAMPNPGRDTIPWRNRPQRMTFVKTGGNPEVRRGHWKDLPPRWRSILEDAGATAIGRGTGDITEIFFAACRTHGLSTEHRFEIVLALMQELDLYVREYRMTAWVSAMLDLPVNIYGRGWGHLSHKAKQARFYPAVDASLLPSICAGTQFMLNTSPNVSSGIHERVAYGLDSRCCVVSDKNTFSEERLADVPTFFGIDSNSPDLPGELAELYHSKTDYTDVTQVGVDFVSRNYGGKDFMHSLLLIANELKAADSLLSNFCIPDGVSVA